MSVDLQAPETSSPFATIEEAIADIRSGRFVVVVDDADRENEGDLTIAAQFVTPESINFMATHARRPPNWASIGSGGTSARTRCTTQWTTSAAISAAGT